MPTTDARTFYDQHPFDWTPTDAASPADAAIGPALAAWISSLPKKLMVVDIGCGPGRVLGFLARNGFSCIGLDRSRISVELAVARVHRPALVSDNLRLPFANESIGAIISDGVIHHTGDPESAFAENCRVLEPGGRMYLAVYKPFGKYPWLYEYPGAVVRAGVRRRWTRPFVTLGFQVPYFLVHAIRSKGRRTWKGAQNLFYDYFVSPHVEFLSREVVEQWCANNGVAVVLYDVNRGGNVHSFSIQKHSR